MRIKQAFPLLEDVKTRVLVLKMSDNDVKYIQKGSPQMSFLGVVPIKLNAVKVPHAGSHF